MINPFKILNLSPNSEKKEIIQATALAMREKRYSGQDIAQAQKMLLDPLKNRALKFIYTLDFENLKQELTIGEQQRQTAKPLKRLSIFDQN